MKTSATNTITMNYCDCGNPLPERHVCFECRPNFIEASHILHTMLDELLGKDTVGNLWGISKIQELLNKDGVTTIEKYDLVYYIRVVVDLINTLYSDLKRIRTDKLKKQFNLMKVLITQLSCMTYRELFATFPILIEFDGTSIDGGDPIDHFIGIAREQIEECGISLYQVEIDTVAGDNIIEFFYGGNRDLLEFWCILRKISKLLLKRDKELYNKYTSDDLIDNIKLRL